MAVLKSTNFKTVYECPDKGVNIQIETKKLKIIKSNRERLIPVVKTIMLCGRENIPLRGHRDDSELSDEIGQGKFRVLLHFRMDAGNSNLQKHLETAPKNATYLSKTSQNKLIENCHSLIMKNVKTKSKLCDGGVNMPGMFNGVQARLKQIQPLAVYMHCAAHKLNLAVVKACSLPSVRNMMGVAGSVTNYVRESAKRLELIKEAFLEKHPKKKSVKLKSLSDTRWLERHDAFLQFKELCNCIVLFLEEMTRNSPSSQSASFYDLISSYL
ncbi:hypothetical protein RN001_013418 [Aquatica leii]|uniref:DUF4371 domain-containing protein n=1 Tax=Aquatica leii TaxID=1421715 RepID=A0AAN7P2T3_9COLE|nr:hypothetical protein RN001_013418 [Aquatica leii]